jgi:hypothetical protein
MEVKRKWLAVRVNKINGLNLFQVNFFEDQLFLTAATCNNGVTTYFYLFQDQEKDLKPIKGLIFKVIEDIKDIPTKGNNNLKPMLLPAFLLKKHNPIEEYIKAGFYCLPIVKNEKFPANYGEFKHGLHSATNDPIKIISFKQIAIAPEKSGVVVIDFDFSKMGKKEKCKAMNLFDILPTTYTATSRSGGIHLFYKVTDNEKYKAVKLKGFDNIDICHNRPLVIEPSTISEKGNYGMKTGGYFMHGTPEDLQPLPPFLKSLIPKRGESTKKKPVFIENKNIRNFKKDMKIEFIITGWKKNYLERVLNDELNKLRTATPQNKNNTLNEVTLRLFSYAYGGEFDPVLLEQEILMIAEEIGQTEKEAIKTVESAKSKAITQPTTVSQGDEKGCKMLDNWLLMAKKKN